MFWWKKTDASSSFEIRRNWKKTIFDRSAALLLAAALLLPIPTLTQISLTAPALAASPPTVVGISTNSGPDTGGTDVTISGTNFTTSSGFASISTSGRTTCGISKDGDAYCWGRNVAGQVGNGSTADSHVPVKVTGAMNNFDIRQVSSSYYLSCAVTTTDKAYCWGNNSSGELGDNTTNDSSTPVPIYMNGGLSGKSIKDISVGDDHACVLTTDNLPYCWGNNDSGELGNGSTVERHVPVAVNRSGALNGKTVQSIDAGDNSTCAVTTDGTAYCWGDNSDGQLGDSTNTERHAPVAVDMTGALAGKTVQSISASEYHTCAVATDGTAYCWGNNFQGELGDNSTNDSNVPVAVNTTGALAGKTVQSISAGDYHTCAVASDNQAYCWGSNSSGKLGNNSTTDSHVPVAVDTSGALSGKTILSIQAAFENSCVLAADNSTFCWGAGQNGAIGNGGTSDRHVPVAVHNMPVTETQVKFGGILAANVNVVNSTTITATTPQHPAQTVDVSVTNISQQDTLTGAFTYTSTSPTIDSVSPNTGGINGGESVTITGTNFKEDAVASTSAGLNHTCLTTFSGKLYCWGLNDYGQLGDGTTTKRTIPTQITIPGKKVTSVSTDFNTTCATTTDGLAYCWGQNDLGQVGDGTTSPMRTSPTPVDTSGALNGKTVRSVIAGGYHGCAVTTESLIYCWGSNLYGQLGDNTNTDRLTPTLVNVDNKNISLADAGWNHTCVVTTDYYTYCWGQNGDGQLGVGHISDLNTPTRVPLSNSGPVVDLTVGSYSTCLVDTANQLYCWGANDNGQIGNGTTNDQITPLQISVSGKSVVDTSTNFTTTCATTNDNYVYCWGDNTYGQLGDGTTNTSTTPTGTTRVWTLYSETSQTVVVGSYHACTFTDSNSVWCWGSNLNGQTGGGSPYNGQVTPLDADLTNVTWESANIKFDGSAGTGTTLVNSTTITTTTPAHAAGVVDVELTRIDGSTDILASSYTYQGPATAPDAPTNLQSTPAQNAVDLTWSAPANDGDSPITDYLVEYSSDGGISWSPFNHSPSAATTLSVTGLTPSTNYGFRVSAVNAIGTSPASLETYDSPIYLTLSNTGNVAISVSPSGLTTVSSSKHSVSVTTNSVTGYTVTLETIGANRNLVHGSDSILPSMGTLSSPTSLAVNTWGYRVDNVGGFNGTTTLETNVNSSSFNWAGVPANGSADTIKSSPSPATNEQTDIWYAMNVSSNKPSGSYNTSVLYTAVAN